MSRNAGSRGLERFTGSKGEILVDARFAPLYLTSWRGKVDAEVLDKLYAWLLDESAAIAAKGGCIAYVNDLGAIETASSGVRQIFVDRAANLRHTVHGQVNVGAWHVVGEGEARGILAKLAWVSPNDWKGYEVSSWAEGIRAAQEALREAGIEIEEPEPEDYAFPD
ncbi:hypothetical protein G6O69_17660 [Pseudenhygromyxa sp. WMMC2535]|uniref:hypothetical protein n=1 Tax=Pseudenhygromyxa sp. WMMC2535 TaxID=2712867 RepID=UPI001551E9AF|nr:hypothetical protein [Pseudenhygromyxa sp. WMMC2535]NVB39674.1 hypothetical protein [Pseudenhygromyxa sp. WMMC2535]